MEHLAKTPSPDSIYSEVVEAEIIENNKTVKKYVVVFKAAYSKKEDADKLLNLDKMLDKT